MFCSALQTSTSEKLNKLAAEFVSSEANVILVSGRDATLAASRVTSTIPIVMAPVGNAFVTSFSRPAGNIAGLTIQQHDTDAKLITLLKETVPDLSKVVVLHRKSVGTHHEVFEAARDTGLEVIRLFVVHNRATFAPLIRKIGAAALSHGLPAAASERDYAEAGFLLTYTADEADLKRRAASYVDRILRGTKLGDLPVEQPTKFELVVNEKTAKALGLTIPQTILARADEVIE
jgi:putative ABC transport system substrate-binding protein